MKNKSQHYYFALAFVVLILSQLLTFFYRPYVYSNNINDFGFADTIGSLVSVIAICCLFWSFKSYSNKQKNQHILLAVLIYGVVWEPMGLLGIYGTFDWKDIIATFISGGITFLLKEFIERNTETPVL